MKLKLRSKFFTSEGVLVAPKDGVVEVLDSEIPPTSAKVIEKETKAKPKSRKPKAKVVKEEGAETLADLTLPDIVPNE